MKSLRYLLSTCLVAFAIVQTTQSMNLKKLLEQPAPLKGNNLTAAKSIIFNATNQDLSKMSEDKLDDFYSDINDLIDKLPKNIQAQYKAPFKAKYKNAKKRFKGQPFESQSIDSAKQEATTKFAYVINSFANSNNDIAARMNELKPGTDITHTQYLLNTIAILRSMPLNQFDQSFYDAFNDVFNKLNQDLNNNDTPAAVIDLLELSQMIYFLSLASSNATHLYNQVQIRVQGNKLLENILDIPYLDEDNNE